MRETDEESSPNDTCPSFLFKIFVLMWTIKVFIDFVTTSLLFLCFGFVFFFFFLLQDMGNLSSPARDWTQTPCIGRQSLTTGLPGKSSCPSFLYHPGFWWISCMPLWQLLCYVTDRLGPTSYMCLRLHFTETIGNRTLVAVMTLTMASRIPEPTIWTNPTDHQGLH